MAMLGGLGLSENAPPVLRGPLQDTTGHHFAILRTESGYGALQKTGREAGNHELLLIDAIALGPRANWPVRQAQVSPAYVQYFSYSLMDRKDGLDVVLRINGDEVGSYSFRQDELADAVTTEIPIAAFAERAIK